MFTIPQNHERESVKVLRECIDLQIKKSQDYQNPNSNVVQAMHYRRGIDSIHDILQGKLYRAQSLIESGRADSANFESLEDTYKDLINYASFAVAWLRYGVPGQDKERDIFNRKKSTYSINSQITDSVTQSGTYRPADNTVKWNAETGTYTVNMGTSHVS